MFITRNKHILVFALVIAFYAIPCFAVSKKGANEPLLNGDGMLNYLKSNLKGSKNIQKYKPGKDFTNAIERYRIARKTGKIKEEDESILNDISSEKTSSELIEKVSKLLYKAKEKIEEKETNQNAVTSPQKDPNYISDEDFNKQLRNYDFRMPANYRIIVR